MIKSQNRKLKFLVIITFSFASFSLSGFCSTAKEKLSIADSLFRQQKYTQSFDLYQEIYAQHNKVSPAMLLKMAFVKEGLSEYSNALYFLNLYYLKTYDKRALKKMENLAEQHNLLGYNYDDVEFFLNLYHQYQLEIDLSVISIVLFVMALMIYQKRKTKRLAMTTAYTYIALLVVLFLINNFGRERPKAIIASDNVYIMDGPSAGANVIEVVSNGHRVEVVGKQDVWTKISWQDQKAFVREFDLRQVEL
jgi:hypothetical protein